MSKINIVSDIENFFLEEIEKSSQQNSLNFSPLLNTYLAKMLMRFSDTQFYQNQISSEEDQNKSLAEIWMESATLSPKEQFQKLQSLGDYTLFTSGFFAERIHGSIMDMDYYHAIGSRSYEKVGSLGSSLNLEKRLNVFFELAAQFKKIAEILEELSVKSNLFSDQDMLKLYQRWKNTGSTKIAKILHSKGVIPPKTSEDNN